jgi:hypothetical protein
LNHGRKAYANGCRCDVCRLANSEYCKGYRKRLRENEPLRFQEMREKNREYGRNYYADPETRQRMLRQMAERNKSQREIISSIKLDRGCVDCGYRLHPDALEFDHLRDKSFTISECRSRSINSLLAEIEKCEVVCANCHRIRTSNRRSLALTEPSLN